MLRTVVLIVRLAVLQLFASRTYSRWLKWFRIADALLTSLVCIGNGIVLLSSPADAVTFDVAVACWITLGFAVGRLPWTLLLGRLGPPTVVHEGAVDWMGESGQTVRQALCDMLFSGSAFIVLFILNVFFLMRGEACRQHSASLLVDCRLRVATFTGLIGLNCACASFSVAVLAFAPRPAESLPEMPSGGQKAAAGLTRDRVARLPEHTFGDSEAPATRSQCSICLEDFQQGEGVRYLPCGHHFHARCVDEWLTRVAECPLRCPSVFGKASRTRRGSMAIPEITIV